MMVTSKPPSHVSHTHLSTLFKERANMLNKIEDRIVLLFSSGATLPSERSDAVKECLLEISSILKENYVNVVSVLKSLDKEYISSSSSSSSAPFSLNYYLQDSYPKVCLGFENPLLEKPESIDNQHILMRLVIIHFYRSGLFDVAETLEKESNVLIDSIAKDQFKALFLICSALENTEGPNIEPLVEWANSVVATGAKENHPTPSFKEDIHELLFQACSLRFVFLISKNELDCALEYSKSELSFFSQDKYLQSTFDCTVVFRDQETNVFLAVPSTPCGCFAAYSES
ncbi:hypothetical protein DI09_29p260 [Mitosporidium daphniae]|uniref:Uncharacterized protein n=1 Tax=Mitosporidium daphniae TaxID=1485682 RepID=A0A098VRV5_9MICR|nr:uncharacterized protein DI09_29p260 [Mitosporidium daphniae]KGG51705.1 hypothetical protein DI09_29p260 [Mitosporidium daphniae]|eukprot:XP_013238132.1 uncharacterized protein DI09_29p260 [Mitosporidium daphniae]